MNLRKRRRRRALILLAVMFFVCTVLVVRYRYEPALSALAVTQVQNVTTNLINAAVEEELSRGKLHYDNLIKIETTPDGNVSALMTDIYEVNRVKLEILNLLSAKIKDVSNEEFGVPLGSVIMPLLFSGRGPIVPIRYVAIRSVDANFENVFSHAGINQTLHQIVLCVDVTVTVMLPIGTMDVTSNSDMVIAQTVIVGEVPQTVISITGENNGSER